MAEATFQMLVDMCNKVGWERGIKALEEESLKFERLQADLFAGTPAQMKQGMELSRKIIKQNLTIAKLKQYKRENVDKPKSAMQK